MNLQIKNIKGKLFGNKLAQCEISKTTHAFYNPEYGYLSFKGMNVKDYGVKLPYTPKGNKKALQSILDQGGFTDLSNVEWVQSLN